MAENYYIGKKRRCKKHIFKRRRVGILLILLAVFLFCNAVLYPQLTALSERAIELHITNITVKKATEVLTVSQYAYEDLLHLQYAENGRLASLSVNTARLNLLRYTLASAILDELGGRSLSVSVPLGNAFGLFFLSDTGGITVRARCAESMTVGFSSSFTECGINQTRHALGFEMHLRVTYLLPLFRRTLDITCHIPAAETVIVGEVPDSFTDISRLTDEVTEFDIDDAVDFGSVLDQR